MIDDRTFGERLRASQAAPVVLASHMTWAPSRLEGLPWNARPGAAPLWWWVVGAIALVLLTLI